MKIAHFALKRVMPMVAKRAASQPNLKILGNRVASQMTPSTGRFFSSSAQTTLLDILKREEAEEKDTGNLEVPKELADLKSSLESKWKIVEDGATTNLFLKDKKVQVSFHCQDMVEPEPSFEEGEEDDEAASAVRFCVTTSKAGRTLVINCISEFGEARIEGVLTTDTPAEDVHAHQGELPEKTKYQGPEYIELAEDLQEAFYAYMEDELGVNNDVASFVAMYTDYREQMQYVQFLKDTQSIIA